MKNNEILKYSRSTWRPEREGALANNSPENTYFSNNFFITYKNEYEKIIFQGFRSQATSRK